MDLADVEYLLTNHKNTLVKLKGGGDFRSQECVELLKNADIVTNPPFSWFQTNDLCCVLALYNIFDSVCIYVIDARGQNLP